jgi:CBS-domain-containing membrane protein
MTTILSEMDCLRAILGAVYNDSPAVGVASEFMTEDVISVALHDNIVDVANDMLKHKHRRRPVIDQRGRLVGQVTCRQLLRGVKDFVSPKDPSEH